MLGACGMRERAPTAPRLWSLGAPVDTWFVASPDPSGTDRRSSGGYLTALRHARCDSAPAALEALGATRQMLGD